MLVQNNKMSYALDSSPANIKALVVKTRDFLARFEALHANEIAEIFK